MNAIRSGQCINQVIRLSVKLIEKIWSELLHKNCNDLSSYKFFLLILLREYVLGRMTILSHVVFTGSLQVEMHESEKVYNGRKRWKQKAE